LLDYENYPPISDKYIYVDYSVITDSNFIDTKEFSYSINEIELEDNNFGLYDEPKEYNYISW